MTLNKQTGNMYGFITHTWNPLIGKCPHNCSYCSTNKLKKRFPIMKKRYSGDLRLDENQFHDLGEGKTIFVCAQNDLFAAETPSFIQFLILDHCVQSPENTYFFQTKNSRQLCLSLNNLVIKENFLKKQIYCVTVETNINTYLIQYSGVISSQDRIKYIGKLSHKGYKTHITIEPIIEFDSILFPKMIIEAGPDQVNIGADSGNNDLPEPSWDKVQKLIQELENAGIKVWQKKNLERLKK